MQQREQALVDLVWHVLTGVSARRPSSILDAGCGEGATLARFAELATPDSLELTGISLSRSQIDIAARCLPQASWLVGNMLDDPRLPNDRFDAVVAIQSTEYIGPANLTTFMTKAASCLALQGTLIVVAGSWVAPPSAADAVVKLFQHLSSAKPALTGDYYQAAQEAGLRLVGDLDLAPATMHYWRVCRDSPALRRSPDGVIENGFYQALKAGRADYRLYLWQQPD
jgi:cyclopropane fatty-acyl-phospholipid synthase-like methyltransferase